MPGDKTDLCLYRFLNNIYDFEKKYLRNHLQERFLHLTQWLRASCHWCACKELVCFHHFACCDCDRSGKFM